MEKERRIRLIAIIALCISVVGLSIGFAAFTRDLNIQFSDTNVNISGDLDVKVLASDDPDDTSNIVDVIRNQDNLFTTPFMISDDRTSISGGSVTFTDFDQNVAYLMYLRNYSEYDAYLKKIDVLNYENSDEFIVCTALPGTSQDLVDDVCDYINVELITVDFEFSFDFLNVGSFDFSNVMLPSNDFTAFFINISFNRDDAGDLTLPNGDFKINFGDIKFSYSSLEG